MRRSAVAGGSPAGVRCPDTSETASLDVFCISDCYTFGIYMNSINGTHLGKDEICAKHVFYCTFLLPRKLQESGPATYLKLEKLYCWDQVLSTLSKDWKCRGHRQEGNWPTLIH